MVYPLASLLATNQVSLGDVLSIDWDGRENGLTFMKEAEGALVPMASPVPDTAHRSRCRNLRRPRAFLPCTCDGCRGNRAANGRSARIARGKGEEREKIGISPVISCRREIHAGSRCSRSACLAPGVAYYVR